MDEITSGMTAEETIPSPEESGEGNSFSEEVTSEETFESAESEEAPIEPDAPDYAAIVEEDVKELRESFPELRTIKDVTELKNPVRFAALRDLGLTATEAYLASGGARRAYDNRSHLTATVPAPARVASEIPRREYDVARELFSDMTDSDIRKLYRKVTK